MAKLIDPDLVAMNSTRTASKFGVALLAGATFFLSSLAAEPARAGNGGVAIGVGALGLGLLLNEGSRSEAYSGNNDNDDDDYQERSYRKKSTPRSTRKQSNPPQIQFSQEVLEIQKSLNQAGYDAGKEDGVGGGQTTAAVKAFQRGFGYEETGTLTPAQRKRLYVVAPSMANTGTGGGAQEVHPAGDASPQAASVEQGSYKPNLGNETPQEETKTVAGHENTGQTIPEAEIEPSMLQVEKALFSLQLIKRLPDGKIDDETVAAIKQYQSHFQQSPTGELTPEQRANLISMARAYFAFEKK